MKINKIEINNYRAFYGNYSINIEGKNILIYGENGSGKSSLYKALEEFFCNASNSISSIEQNPYEKNIFNQSDDEGISIEFYHLPPNTGSVSDIFSTSSISRQSFIQDIGKQNPFFTYKRILKTFLIEPDKDIENVLWKLLVEEILASYEIPYEGTKYTIGEIWKQLKDDTKAARINPSRKFSPLQESFNDRIKELLKDLSEKTEKYLTDYFSTNLKLTLSLVSDFNITDKETAIKAIDEARINANINFFTKPLNEHHNFLNEARLSALAICMYLASLKTIDEPNGLKILVLDDIFIGLDMSNRLPLLDILNDNFKDYQIFITTHDRQWFELSKQWFEDKAENEWKFYEMYVDDISNEGFEVPKLISDKNNLDKALIHFKNNDYPASANYLRKAVEELIQSNFYKLLYINDDGEEPKKLNNKFESIIKYLKCIEYNSINPVVYQAIIDLKTYIMFIANPLSHYETDTQIFKGELKKIQNAIREVQPINFNNVKPLIYSSENIYLEISISSSFKKLYQFKTLDKILTIDLEGNKHITDIEIKSITWKGIEVSKEAEENPFGYYQKNSFSDVLKKIIEYENNEKQKKQEELLSLPNWKDAFFKYGEDNTTRKSLNQLAIQI